MIRPVLLLWSSGASDEEIDTAYVSVRSLGLQVLTEGRCPVLGALSKKHVLRLE
jgi:hypothetical protein